MPMYPDRFGDIRKRFRGASVALTLSGPLTYATDFPQGSYVGTINGVPAGVTPTLTPNDGRLTIAAGSQSGSWNVVVGASASAAGTSIAIDVAAAGATDATATIPVTLPDGNYAANDPPSTTGSMMQFTRVASNGGIVVAAANGTLGPAVPHSSAPLRKAHAANPSIVKYGIWAYLAFRGDAGDNTQRTFLWRQLLIGFNVLDMTRWIDLGVIMAPAATPVGFNGTWDPSICVYKGNLLLSWQNGGSSLPTGAPNANELFTSVGTVASDGSVAWAAPVDAGFANGAGSVFPIGNTLYAFGGSAGVLSYRTTTDLVTWSASSGAILSPTGQTYTTTGIPYGDKDGAACDTQRLFYQAPYLYMGYGATPLGYTGGSKLDWPEGIALARSQAPFTSWDKCNIGPVLLRGPVGAFDAGGVWSGSYFRTSGLPSMMLHEGIGGSALATRDTPYSGFGTTAFSQIGVAFAPADATLANWASETTDLVSGIYTLQNVASGLYLGAAGTANSSLVKGYVASHQWYITKSLDGYYTISSVEAGADRTQALGNNASARTLGTNLITYTAPATATVAYTLQEFKLMPISHSAVSAGIYRLLNRYNGFDVDCGTGTTDGTQLTYTVWAALASQEWQLVKVG